MHLKSQCRVLATSIALVAFLASSPSRAEDDFFEPAALGMGGAVRILGVDASAIHLNPAAMVGQPRYVAGMSYSFYGREKGHIIASGAFDSRTSAFALGTKYTVWTFEPPFDPSSDLRWFPPETIGDSPDHRSWHRWDIAAAYAFLQRRINVGLTARIVRQEFDLRDNRTFFTLDAGLTFYPAQFIGFGISAQNFVPTKEERFPIRLSPGLAIYVPNFLSIGVDVVFDFSDPEAMTTDLHGGVDLTLFRLISIRAGYYGERQFTENYVTWGLGLRIDQAKLKIAYAMRVEVGPMDRPIRQDKPPANSRILNSIGFDLTF